MAIFDPNQDKTPPVPLIIEDNKRQRDPGIQGDTMDRKDEMPINLQEHNEQQNGQANTFSIFNPYFTGRPRTTLCRSKYVSIDRQEIIRRIKSSENRSASPEQGRTPTEARHRRSPSLSSSRTLPPVSYKNDHDSMEFSGMNIERPRSALHRGDFHDADTSSTVCRQFGHKRMGQPVPVPSTSPIVPWHPDFPVSELQRSRQGCALPIPPSINSFHSTSRVRATSLASCTTSFVYKPPTSPLVHSSRPDTPDSPVMRSRSPDRSRRHTFSPYATLRPMEPARQCGSAIQSETGSQPPSFPLERSFPYQAHQPRRSMNSFPATFDALAERRRLSLSGWPLHHAPMVGSYEESILRGRMSTIPSKPLNFVAQIGVLGRGNCKSSLKCPPHASVAFPAVFYSYAIGPKSPLSDNQPSPYVGLIDLENSLRTTELVSGKRRQNLRSALRERTSRSSSETREEIGGSVSHTHRRRRQKRGRRSESPRFPFGGNYRIPQQGQLQVVIKNPNKTAVKLFLVPYDLRDMEAGQKTFIRQRSYSAGPVLDMPLSSRTNLGTNRPEAALSTTDDPSERPILRYLIHINICCPSRGKYFLYKSIRVVFANRVPDGKEKLHNEIQLPEPRYSVFRVSRDLNAASLHDSASANSQEKHVLSNTYRPTVPVRLPQKEGDALNWPSSPPGPTAVSILHEGRAQNRTFSYESFDPSGARFTQQPSPKITEAISAQSIICVPSTSYEPEQRVNSCLIKPDATDGSFDFERNASLDKNERLGNGHGESLLSKQLKDLAVQAHITEPSRSRE